MYSNPAFWHGSGTGLANMCYHFLLPCPADIALWSQDSSLLSQEAASGLPNTGGDETYFPCLAGGFHWRLGRGAGLLGSTSSFGGEHETSRQLIISVICPVYKHLIWGPQCYQQFLDSGIFPSTSTTLIRVRTIKGNLTSFTTSMG